MFRGTLRFQDIFEVFFYTRCKKEKSYYEEYSSCEDCREPGNSGSND